MKVQKLNLFGFKSFKELKNFSLENLNVLIGANGTGKSNFISFFRFLKWMLNSPGELQNFISAKAGGANLLLHDGAEITSEVKASLEFQTEKGVSHYRFRLSHAVGDTLVFSEEEYRKERNGAKKETDWISLGSGHRETKLLEQTSDAPVNVLRQCMIYQFHNTSDTARIRQKWDQEDNHTLREDGSNLAPFLLRLRESEPKYYRRIVETIRQVVPFFGDFVLQPQYGNLLLQWREIGTDLIFGSHQASDGTIRIMALITLLLQPMNQLPPVMILDEPELGLHPYAMNLLAGLLKSTSLHSQVILATQSTDLINYFDPENLIIVERHGRKSVLKRLDTEKLSTWLEEYSLAELWEKNVLGGRPKPL